MSLRKNVEATLLDGLEQLIREGSSRRYWCSNRATSDALVALNTCLPLGEFPQLRIGALNHLLAQSETTIDGKRHWMEEVWDSSIAALAIATEPIRFSKEINQTYHWLCSKYLTTYNSWNDELWETLCAINALSYLNRTLPIVNTREQYDFSGAAEWLMRMMNTPSPGLLINWSSTALFVLFGFSPSLPGLNVELKERIITSARLCSARLLEAPITKSDDLLWTPEAWSNGLVLWAISLSQQGMLSEESSFKMIKWFKDRIAREDLPTEDRAFSCIGLYRYLEYLLMSEINKEREPDRIKNNTDLYIEESKEKLKTKIAIKLKQRIQDFKPSPPILSTNHYAGYYSINIHQKGANVFMIILFTFLLSYLSWESQSATDETIKWLVLIPIILGTLATIAQLANFTFFSKKKEIKEE